MYTHAHSHTAMLAKQSLTDFTRRACVCVHECVSKNSNIERILAHTHTQTHRVNELEFFSVDLTHLTTTNMCTTHNPYTHRERDSCSTNSYTHTHMHAKWRSKRAQTHTLKRELNQQKHSRPPEPHESIRIWRLCRSELSATKIRTANARAGQLEVAAFRSVIVHDCESNEWAISLIESLGKMAESKGSLIAKSVQKHAGRAKEKVCVLFLVYFGFLKWRKRKRKEGKEETFVYNSQFLLFEIPTSELLEYVQKFVSNIKRHFHLCHSVGYEKWKNRWFKSDTARKSRSINQNHRPEKEKKSKIKNAMKN